MNDQKAWELALVRLQALKANLPQTITEARVAEYHAILDSLETASGEDFSHFYIPRSDMRPQASGIPFAGRNQHKITYSTELYGDEELFKRQVDGATRYAQKVDSSQRGSANKGESRDYWAMSNIELENLAVKHNMGGYADQTMNIDRGIIIQQLLLRDAALQPERPATQSHTINVGAMTDSVIQQDSIRSSATATSPSPKSHSFSLGGVTEKVVATIIGAGLLALIGRWLSHFWRP
jgi:hypothetical protein